MNKRFIYETKIYQRIKKFNKAYIINNKESLTIKVIHIYQERARI